MRHWEHQGTDSGRDEQRRQQNEYHAALAEQVRLQEAKKLADRRDRMTTQQPLPHQRGSGGNGPPVQGGLFAGLGQNHTVGKSTYARGHHLEKMTADLKKAGQPPPDQMNVPGPEPPYAAYNKGPPPAQYNAPQPYAQQHQYAPPPQEQQQYHPPPQQGGYPEQQYQQMPHPEMNAPLHQPFPQQGYHQIGYDNHPHQQPFLPLPPPPYGATNHPSPSPPSQLQHQQPPSSSHGRRHQVSAIVAPDPTRRTAQLETQSFLKQQMEDNQRRKAEAKRKKDEEERAEMQRIEKELKVQAEAFEAEKRSKVKDAVLKQQQLEADLRLKQEEELKKTNPKLRHKQLTQDDLAVPTQPQPHGFSPDGHPFGTPRDLPGFGPSSQFTPQDNPPWQTQPQNHTFQMQALPQNHPGEQQGFFGGAPPSYPPNSGALTSDAYSSAMYPLPMQQIPSSMMMPPMQMQSSPSMNQFMDARLQMLTNELASQRAMVEQLVHQTPTPRGPALTVDDFERLRRDMQAELDRRDAMHQQELAVWKSRAGGGGIVQTQSTRHLPGVDNNDLNNHTNKRSRVVSPETPLRGGQKAVYSLSSDENIAGE
ncbi:hypothetical protein B5M09_005039 [Aphanomyces astaci]|uniref:Uncharacterized protein n=1 Tax=Aphanomyces astaci TaxID=112090 RepID=A0A425D839_APHAT|nr:hypothetical protein B5M09_005039 [Aphanomyces astaci]